MAAAVVEEEFCCTGPFPSVRSRSRRIRGRRSKQSSAVFDKRAERRDARPRGDHHHRHAEIGRESESTRVCADGAVDRVPGG